MYLITEFKRKQSLTTSTKQYKTGKSKNGKTVLIPKRILVAKAVSNGKMLGNEFPLVDKVVAVVVLAALNFTY